MDKPQTASVGLALLLPRVSPEVGKRSFSTEGDELRESPGMRNELYSVKFFR